MSTIASKTITGDNSFTDPVRLTGFFNLSLRGTFVATVTVQRSFDEMVTWMANTRGIGEYELHQIYDD